MKPPCYVLLALVAAVFAAPAAAQETRSTELARQLGALMVEQKLTAAAARDPEAPNRYVAAMLFPDVQLLVVAAESTAPAWIEDQLAQKNYSEIYMSLQQASVAATKVFFQDLKADGLHSKAGDGVDVLYEQVVNQTMFDGDPGKHKQSEAEYAKKLSAADERYSRLLTLLIGQLKPAASSSTR